MHLCLILFPGFPLLGYALLRALVRLTNDISGRLLLSCQVRGLTGDTVNSADGDTLTAEASQWRGAQGFDLVLLLAGPDALRCLPLGLRGFLARAEAAGVTLGGIGGGATVLAHLGYLDGHEAVLDPPPSQAIRARGIAPSDAGFVLDRCRLTAGGGIATAEAFLALLARRHGTPLACRVGEALAHGHLPENAGLAPLRPAGDPQMAGMQRIMSSSLADPLPLTHIAADLGLSPKQLRSRCRKLLGRTPAEVYRDLRLARADRLIRDTTLSVAEIARATGFASPSAFTRSYRATHGHAPRTIRKAG